jgi:hypothetical protein
MQTGVPTDASSEGVETGVPTDASSEGVETGVPTDASSEGVETGSKAVAARRRQKPIFEVVCVYKPAAEQ